GYAVGQLAGPVLSALSTALTHRLEPALFVATLALLAAGLLVFKIPARAARRQLAGE
ncbi:MFS transporter, partial [Serratia rubidaea]|nr:MFS transporter [Serratia rubidaea]